MIITIAIDTDDDKDGLKTLEAFVEALKRQDVKVSIKTQPPKVVTDIYDAARRRSAGENVVCTYQTKKRGRKPKNMNTEA